MFKHVGLAVAMSAALIATAPASNAATVLTLEGGFVGMQHIWHFVPTQLQGDLCKSPNHCQPVDYFAFPGGAFTDQGATKVQQAIAALPTGEQIVLFGHSQGGQVVYSDLRRFAADPANAPDPARLTWVSIGNPENAYGRRPKTEGSTAPWLPPDTAYKGTEVIRQYDGWADWPDDTSNLLAVANALAGMLFIHTNYRNIDLDDPSCARYTPEVAGQPGNVTYVWVPTKTLPLIAWAGPLAPALDRQLRPIIEKAYHRPVDVPDPNVPSSAAVQPARLAAPTKSTSTKRSTANSEPNSTKSTSERKAKSSTASSARQR